MILGRYFGAQKAEVFEKVQLSKEDNRLGEVGNASDWHQKSMSDGSPNVYDKWAHEYEKDLLSEGWNSPVKFLFFFYPPFLFFLCFSFLFHVFLFLF